RHAGRIVAVGDAVAVVVGRVGADLGERRAHVRIEVVAVGSAAGHVDEGVAVRVLALEDAEAVDAPVGGAEVEVVAVEVDDATRRAPASPLAAAALAARSLAAGPLRAR